MSTSLDEPLIIGPSQHPCNGEGEDLGRGRTFGTGPRPKPPPPNAPKGLESPGSEISQLKESRNTPLSKTCPSSRGVGPQGAGRIEVHVLPRHAEIHLT